MPVSAICMLVVTLFMSAPAKASMAITVSGFTASITPFTISTVSIPVVPITPGAIADTSP